ncbi:nucleoporin NUP53 isoform X2 [Cimex lectularius]|nr:nucleoporin NUP53 isoform X2 [Cimex lectularius]
MYYLLVIVFGYFVYGLLVEVKVYFERKANATPVYNCCEHEDRLLRRYRWLSSEYQRLEQPRKNVWAETMVGEMKSPGASGQYLPGFLLGEPEVNHEFLSRSQASPEKMNVSPRHGESPLQITSFRPHYNHGSKMVLNGPPISSLFDEEMKAKNAEVTTDRTIGATPDRMDTVGNDAVDSEGHWIVVYGFPPSASAHVLSIFSQLGQVMEHSFPTSGNWMFLKFGNRGDVRKALGYNERIINGNIMIGVSERKNINQMRLSCPTSPAFNNSVTAQAFSPTSPKIRHLSLSRREMATPDQPTPQKDTSVVGKV